MFRNFLKLHHYKRIVAVNNLGSGISLDNKLGCQKSDFGRYLALRRPKTINVVFSKYFFTSSCLNNELHARTCWKCGRDTNPERELFFCACGLVQRPAKHLTFYDLLLLKQSFDIDISTLSKRFKDTQRQLHPDKFSTKSKEEQHYAEEQSSLLNKSYDTLLKPLSRAIYLLELADITISENDSVSDPEFLMNMMEDFETISVASCPDDVATLENKNDSRIEKCVQDLSKAFSQQHLVRAKNLTIELRYFTTIQDRIKELRMKSLE